jgi:RNA-directed DNA polymerase
MDRVRRRIKDKRMLALAKAFLKAGVMTADGDQEETYTGTQQGGILSPCPFTGSRELVSGEGGEWR